MSMDDNTQAGELDRAILKAITSCGHTIDAETVELHYDPKQPGNNALNQLHRRIRAALAQAAPAQASAAVVPETSYTDAIIASWLDAEHPDDRAITAFEKKMREKMAASRAKGRSGWDDPAQCSAERLSAMLREHVEKGDPVDVANFAMMLSARGERIASAAPQGVAAPAAMTDGLAELIEDLDELASDMNFEGNQEMDEQAQRRAALIFRGAQMLLLAKPRAADDGLTCEQWATMAERVYLACGDSVDEAKALAAYLADQQDWLGDDIGDPYEAALEDIEGRPAPAAESQPVAWTTPKYRIGAPPRDNPLPEGWLDDYITSGETKLNKYEMPGVYFVQGVRFAEAHYAARLAAPTAEKAERPAVEERKHG